MTRLSPLSLLSLESELLELESLEPWELLGMGFPGSLELLGLLRFPKCLTWRPRQRLELLGLLELEPLWLLGFLEPGLLGLECQPVVRPLAYRPAEYHLLVVV